MQNYLIDDHNRSSYSETAGVQTIFTSSLPQSKCVCVGATILTNCSAHKTHGRAKIENQSNLWWWW